MNEFKNRLVPKFIFAAMKCANKETKTLKSSKLINFGIQLMNALRESDRNLNKECFHHEIYLTKFDKKFITNVEE